MKITRKLARPSYSGPFEGFKIDRGVPVPGGVKGGKRKYPVLPWARMKIGDSVFIPGLETSSGKQSVIRLTNQDYEHANRGFRLRIVYKPEVVNSQAGTRFWILGTQPYSRSSDDE